MQERFESYARTNIQTYYADSYGDLRSRGYTPITDDHRFIVC